MFVRLYENSERQGKAASAQPWHHPWVRHGVSLQSLPTIRQWNSGMAHTKCSRWRAKCWLGFPKTSTALPPAIPEEKTGSVA